MFKKVFKTVRRQILLGIVKLIDIIMGDGKGFWCWAELYPEEKPKAKPMGDNTYLVEGIECRRCWIPEDGPGGSGKYINMAYMSRSVCKKYCNNPQKYENCWGYGWVKNKRKKGFKHE